MKNSVLAMLGLALAMTLVISPSDASTPTPKRKFDKVFVIVLENASASQALRQPYMKSLLSRGAYLSNFYAAEGHSQPNYFAMTSGSTHGVTTNDMVDLDVRHIGDLLEAKGKSWRQYANGYPGDCFLGKASGRYRRRHAPFLSYKNIQRSPARCAYAVKGSSLDADIAAGRLPTYSLYIPDNDQNGHDAGVATADRWLRSAFDKKFSDPRFMRGMLVVITFDEDDGEHGNHIYTLLLGESVKAGAQVSSRQDFYTLLRTIEDNFSLGTLGQHDKSAKPITGIWR